MSPLVRLPAAFLALVLLAAGCLPAALEDATPDAAVLGVPADALVPGAAAGLHERLSDLSTGHDLVPASLLRFREVRSGLVGSRAPTGAARVARTTGADVAVMVASRTLDREIRGAPFAAYEEVTLRLEVVLLRAEDATELARLSGPRLTGERSLRERALPPLDEDPLVRDLVRRSLNELAPRVAAELEALSESSGG